MEKTNFHDRTYYDLFEECVANNLYNVAVVCGETTLTYKVLAEKVSKMVCLLKKKGVEKQMVVGVLADRSLDMLIAILGILRVGACYLPMDKNSPIEYLNYVLQNSNTKILLTDNLEMTSHIDFLKESIVDIRTYQECAEEHFICKSSPTDLAYIIYTSGTTGVPKGVMIEQRGMMNHLKSKIDLLELTCSTCIAQTASHCFDISIWQFLAALLVGGKVVIVKNELIHNPTLLIQEMNKHNVTIIELVPSYIAIFMKQACKMKKPFQTLRYLLTTGETVPPLLLKEWFFHFQDIPVVNAYGPTEASDDITHYVMKQYCEYDRIPVGTAIENVKIYIFNEQGKLCEKNEKGEICVSGICVGRGYINDDERTREKFVVDPFESGFMMYKTGDIGYWGESGNLMYVGRADNQVKINGYRIELDEIKHCIEQFPGITGATVIINDAQELKQLCAFIVCSHEIELNQLRNYCRIHLQDYKVPNYIFAIDDFPLTSNGKVDKKKLRENIGELLKHNKRADIAVEVKDIPISDKVISIIRDKSGLPIDSTLDKNASFLELNIDSLTFITIIVAVEDELDVELQEYGMDMNNFSNLKSFIDYVEKKFYE